MRLRALLIGCLAISVLQAKPLDIVSRILQTALSKQPGYVRVKSILGIPDVRKIIIQHRLNSSIVDSLDLSRLGFDEVMVKWLKTALNGLNRLNRNKLRKSDWNTETK